MKRQARKLTSSAAWFGCAAGALLVGQLVFAGDAPIQVTIENFARAEADVQIERMAKLAGGVNQFGHVREPTPLDAQTVIRMNRDTLYSFAIVDISEGATLTLPDAGTRYMTAMVVNQDGFINEVFHGGGTFELDLDTFDTRYVVVAVRTLVDAANPEDVALVNGLQDQMKLGAASAKPFVMPNYDMESYQATYAPLLELSKGLPDAANTFGKKGDVDPIRFVLGAAFGWGGLPEKEAFYLNVNPELPVGEYRVTAKDVPVDAFWSISLYNGKGYFEANDRDAYSVNNITATANEDGSFTVHLGGCDDDRVNCLPIMDGWNYAVRLYQPRPEILDGSWTFPEIEAVK